MAPRVVGPSTLRQRFLHMDACPDLFVVLAADGAVGHGNTAWGRLHGRSWLTAFHPDDVAAARSALARARESPVTLRLRMAANGAWKAHEWTLWHDDGLLAIGRDVSPVMDELQRLRRSETQMRTIFETSREGVWMIDMDGITTYANPQMADILGEVPEDMMGRPITDWMDEAERAQAAKNLARRRRGESDRMEFRYRRKDGSHVYTILSAGPILDEDGTPVGSVGMVTDITERRAAEEANKRLSNELEKRVAERTRSLARAVEDLEAFSYTVSHDLRAPLRTLSGFTQLVLERQPEALDEDSQRHLQYIGKAAKQMSGLVEGLLRFARLGRQAVKPKRVDARRMVEDVARHLRGQYPDIRLEVGDLPDCTADPLLLHEVFANLLGNAFKFTTGRPDATVTVTGSLVEGCVTYTVKDNGAGFDMKHADQVWGVFQSVHQGDARAGVGAGLAIVRRIIDRHSGKISVEAQVGVGAAFSFTLEGA